MSDTERASTAAESPSLDALGTSRPEPNSVPLADLGMAAFCPRKLYYARQTDRSPPEEHGTAVELSHAYPALLGASERPDVDGTDDAALLTPPEGELGISPDELRSNLARERDRLDQWDSLVDPAARDVFLAGKDVHGKAAKVLADPPAPTLVSPGEPPPEGVWQPQSVRAVGLAKALAWELETPVERAYVEYPLYGRIREVTFTTRRTATYRRTLRSVQSMDGPPPRLGNDARCQTCRFAEQCGVRTRSLRSLL